MRKMQSIVGELIAALEEFIDPNRVEKSKTYFPTAQRVLGVTNPHIKVVTTELKQVHSEWTPREWIELCKALVDCDIFECQVMAYEILGRNRKLLDALTYDDLEDLWKNLDNWASVDHFTVGVYGVLWGTGVVKDQHIEMLLHSDNFWDRRVAVVSTVALNLKSRGGKGDTARTIGVCERVVREVSHKLDFGTKN